MFEWYRKGTRDEKRTFWSCYFGWALDSYNTQIFSFLVPTLIATWSLTKGAAGAIGTASLISTAIGGWLAGVLSDRIGRVKVLMLTVVWFTGFGVLAGFAQSYEQMIAARALQGIGFGGEWAVGAALMAEVTRPQYRGRAMGFVQSGFCLGWVVAALTASVALAYFPPDVGWRAVFWVSAAPGMLTILVRLGVRDSELFRKTVLGGQIKKATIGSVFERGIFGKCSVASCMVFGLQAAGYVLIVWIPSLLAEKGVRSGSMISSIGCMAVGAFFGFVVGSSMSDAFGRRKTLISMVVGSLVVTLIYIFAPLTSALILPLGALLGFFSLGVFAAVGPFLSELFPTSVRTTCMGFTYNVAKTIAALMIAGVGAVSAKTGLATAVGLCCFGAYAISIIALLFLPETKGTRLESVGGDTKESMLDAIHSSPADPHVARRH